MEFIENADFGYLKNSTIFTNSMLAERNRSQTRIILRRLDGTEVKHGIIPRRLSGAEANGGKLFISANSRSKHQKASFVFHLDFQSL